MTDLTREEGIRIVKLLIAGMLALLFVVGYVFWTDYQGRKSEVNAVRAGCERDKKDREASVILNENILKVFQDSQKEVKAVLTPTRKEALAKIDATTEGLKERSQINCNELYPKASFFP